MDLLRLGAWAALVLLPVAVLGVGLAVYLGLLRARRAEQRLDHVQELLKVRVLPYLERQLAARGKTSRRPAVVVGADGAIHVTGQMEIAEETARVVAQLEDMEGDGQSLATSATQEVFDAGNPHR